MFKFIEKKSFFVFCAVMSAVLSVLPLIFIRQAMTMAFTCEVIIMIVLPILMILFYNNSTKKEFMNVLLTSFITAAVFINITNITIVMGWVFREFGNLTFLQDGIRKNIAAAKTVGTLVVLIIIYIDHLIIHFSEKSSSMAINVNKVAAILMIVVVLFDKISMVIVEMLNPGALAQITIMNRSYMFLSSINSVFYALTAVSAEAFINAQRAAKNIDK